MPALVSLCFGGAAVQVGFAVRHPRRQKGSRKGKQADGNKAGRDNEGTAHIARDE